MTPRWRSRQKARTDPGGDSLGPRLHRAESQRDRARARAREARTRLREARNETLTARFVWWQMRDALRGADTVLDEFLYFPLSPSNPILALWYSQMAEHGFSVRPLPTLDALSEAGPGATFNLHWNWQDTRAAEFDNRRRTDLMLDAIARFVDRGGRFLWSIHEPLPHECPYPEVEIAFRARLAELACGIHLLHPSTLSEAGALYPIPSEKTFVVEHPLFAGYPDLVGRRAARCDLGIDDDSVVLLGFGAIRPYKGFERLVRLLPEIRRRSGRDVRVLLAGRAAVAEYAAQLRALVAETPGATLAEGLVPIEFVQVLMRAADLVVLPYHGGHNSGAAMLALTFDRPTIAPRNDIHRSLEESGLVRLFDPPSDTDLLDVAVRAVADLDRFPGAISAEFASRHDPIVVSRRFAQSVRGVVGGAGGAGTPTVSE